MGRIVKLGQRFHQVQMGVGAFHPADLDNGLRAGLEHRRPITLEMFDPAAVLRIVRAALQDVVEIHCALQSLFIVAGPVIFDKSINDEGLAIHDLTLVQWLAGEVRGPVIAAVFRVEEMGEQKAVALFGGFQVIAVGRAQTFEMRMCKAPDHPALRHKLLFGRRRRLFSGVIGEEVTSVLLVHRGVIPIRHDLLHKLALEFTGALSTVGGDEEQRPKQRQGKTSAAERLLLNARDADF